MTISEMDALDKLLGCRVMGWHLLGGDYISESGIKHSFEGWFPSRNMDQSLQCLDKFAGGCSGSGWNLIYTPWRPESPYTVEIFEKRSACAPTPELAICLAIKAWLESSGGVRD